MSKIYVEYLRHILLECNYITSVISPDFTIEQFLADETLKRAIVRSLEIVGEATKKIPADIKFSWNKIAWKNMAGMRDRLIHDYMGVNYAIVWDVAKNLIPTIKIQIEEIISSNATE
jgi:uncharacterized protein with HEPN domain